ncbi:hypothetical protein N806_22365 [Rhodococcus sp. P27]|nr:hypothetical protein N806_22365 [Rhodococcus sp. P27]
MDTLFRLVVVTDPALGTTLVVANAHVVTMDSERSEHPDGYVVISGNKIVDVGAGKAPVYPNAHVIDGNGCLITPGLVNTHHHLYQWITRGLAADSTLFEWLTTLYPVWAGIDADAVHAAATGGLTWLAKTGCTTTTDHHYVVPRDAGDVFEARSPPLRRLAFDSTRVVGRWTSVRVPAACHRITSWKNSTTS